MKMKLSIEIDLHPVFDDDTITLGEHMRGLKENYPSLVSLLLEAADDPKSLSASIEISRNGNAILHPWPYSH
jgi:hypothetical protein